LLNGEVAVLTFETQGDSDRARADREKANNSSGRVANGDTSPTRP
jgi:hypothetical protein